MRVCGVWSVKKALVMEEERVLDVLPTPIVILSINLGHSPQNEGDVLDRRRFRQGQMHLAREDGRLAGALLARDGAQDQVRRVEQDLDTRVSCGQRRTDRCGDRRGAGP